jgi:hypothetical protein
MYALLISVMRVTCPAHLILLDVLSPTISDEEYELRSSSLCDFLLPLVASINLMFLFFIMMEISNEKK